MSYEIEKLDWKAETDTTTVDLLIKEVVNNMTKLHKYRFDVQGRFDSITDDFKEKVETMLSENDII